MLKGSPTALALLVTVWASVGLAQSGRIDVGPNVQVSRDRANLDFAEVSACADPANPAHVIAAAMYAYQDSGAGQNVRQPTTLFASIDGGKTWRATLDTKPVAPSTPDPSCAFGPKGSAYYTVMTVTRDRGPVALFRSGDAGFTWSAPAMIDSRGLIDRQWVAVDNSEGPNRGRVYVTGFRDSRRPSVRDFVFYGSSDGGTSFDQPVEQRSHYMHNGNAVVLTDGTIVSLRAHPATQKQEAPDLSEPAGGWPRGPVLSVIRSTDGGKTISNPIIVSELHPATPSNRFLLTDYIPSLATDSRGAVFRDRLYAVWLDAGAGRLSVKTSHSADGGRTWSEAVVVSDDRDADPRNAERGPDSVNPTIAVNASGVVGVLWYDRRDNPDFGYWPRFAASLDGGESWTPSVRVSERPMIAALDGVAGFGFKRTDNGRTSHELVFSVHNGENFKSGDTAGLVALGDSFQAFWADNRTGRSQLWTAPVRVAGEVAAMRDVSDSVEFRFTNLRFDVKSRIASADATVRNVGRTALTGPLTVLVTSISSNLTRDVNVIGADNGRDAIGAAWQFSVDAPAGPGALASGNTITRRLRFWLGPWEAASLNPLQLNVRVLAPRR